MSVAALQHGVSPATTVQTQMEPVAEQVNVIHTTRMAGGFAGARLILGGASALDRDARLVHVPGRPPVPYDALGIDIGISSAPLTLDGFAEHGVPAKPLGPYADRWRAFLADGGGPVTVIGGGVGGVADSTSALPPQPQQQQHQPP